MIMLAILVVDMASSCGGSSTRNLNERHLEFGEHSSEKFFLILGEVAAGFLMNHLQLIDEHLGSLKVGLTLRGGGMVDESQAEQDVLHLHLDEIDETLG